jgi:hypothetical protein
MNDVDKVRSFNHCHMPSPIYVSVSYFSPVYILVTNALDRHGQAREGIGKIDYLLFAVNFVCLYMFRPLPSSPPKHLHRQPFLPLLSFCASLHASPRSLCPSKSRRTSYSCAPTSFQSSRSRRILALKTTCLRHRHLAWSTSISTRRVPVPASTLALPFRRKTT